MRRILYCLAIMSAAQVGSDASMPLPSHTQACPTVTVDCPTGVTEASTPVRFTANIEGADPKATLTYNWSVSTGTIISGQGTSAIIVDQAGTADRSITATVKVGGLDSSCPLIASCSKMPGLPALSRKFDEYGNTAFKDEKARLNKFAKQLRSEPESRGYIITYGRRRGRAGEAEAHARHAKSYLVKIHGIDPKRIVTVDGGFRTNLEVELWIAPPGAKPPTVSSDKMQTNKDTVKRN